MRGGPGALTLEEVEEGAVGDGDKALWRRHHPLPGDQGLLQLGHGCSGVSNERGRFEGGGVGSGVNLSVCRFRGERDAGCSTSAVWDLYITMLLGFLEL